jgi:dsDNA-binding SOS-regulon protein
MPYFYKTEADLHDRMLDVFNDALSKMRLAALEPVGSALRTSSSINDGVVQVCGTSEHS